MTVSKMLSQMGIGSPVDRYHTEHAAPVHEYYTYEHAHSDDHSVSHKHGYSGHGHKGNAATSALTLLAFLFFLHILQQCLRDHMASMETPQVMIVTGGREGEETVAKTSKVKIDKSGIDKTNDAIAITEKINENVHELKDNPFDTSKTKRLTRIKTEQHLPKVSTQKHNRPYKIYANRTLRPSFSSAMDTFYMD